MNKPYFDALTQMFQSRSDFDASVLRTLTQMFQSRSAFDASALRLLEEAAKMGEGEAPKGVTPIPVGVVGGDDWGTIRLAPHTEKLAHTEPAPWFMWKLRGFGISGSPPETVQIRALRIGGSRNLLWHEEWVPLSAYLATPPTLRETVVVMAPNYAEFALRNTSDLPVEFGLWALGDVVKGDP